MDADLDTLATALYVRIDDELKMRPELGRWRRPGEVAVAVGALQVLAEPGASVDSGRDSRRDPPQVVVSQLLLEVDAVTAACGG